MKLSEVLTNARKLVEAGWCTGAFAKDANGHNCFYNAEKIAVEYDMLGAIGMSTWAKDPHSIQYDEGQKAKQKAHDAIGAVLLTKGTEKSMAIWNDRSGRTKEEVLAVFDETIAAALKTEETPEVSIPLEVEELDA
jgi:hypothetical protein